MKLISIKKNKYRKNYFDVINLNVYGQEINESQNNTLLTYN